MGWLDSEAFCGYEWKEVLIAVAIFLVLGVVIAVLVVVFAVVHPPKATADDAVMQRFALAPGSPAENSTISYNITTTLSLRNPNVYWGIRYEPLAAAFSFNGSRFDESATVPGFLLAARKATTVCVTVGGVSRPIKLAAGGVKEFAADNETGKFDVELRLDTVLQYKGRKAKCPLVVICPLKLQLVDPAVVATAYQKTKCTVLRARKSGC